MALGGPIAAHGALRTIGVFSSSPIETFDEYHATDARSSLPVLNGAGLVTIPPGTGSVKLEFSSQLGTDLVTPISGMMMGQLGIMDWTFTTPIRRFGAFIENNSGKDGGTAFFYDAADNLLGSLEVSALAKAQKWTWNGWESDTPFKRIQVVGNGLINGFLWYENVRVSEIPNGSTVMLIMAGLPVTWRRRRVS